MSQVFEENKINRAVLYAYAAAYDDQASYPKTNNKFFYHRAPEGYKFVLVSIDLSADRNLAQGVVEMSDGHYFTGWDIFPGVENRETLARVELNDYMLDYKADLNGWDCKEYTVAVRSVLTSKAFRVCCVIWYYLQKMTKFETLHYAVAQPRFNRYRKGYATTVESTEEED